MTKTWRRIISGLEVVGGVSGSAFFLWFFATTSLDLLTVLLALVVLSFYLLSSVAGVLLWREHQAGRAASLIVQAVQLPKLLLPPLTLTLTSGLDFYPYVMFSADAWKIGFDFKFLAFHQLYLNTPGAPVGFGVSVTAAVFQFKLLKKREQLEAYNEEVRVEA